MTVKAYAPRNLEGETYYWEPEDDYGWFDNLSYQAQEGYLGKTARFLSRRKERAAGTGTEFDALRDRSVLEQAVGRVTQQEMYSVLNHEITDLDEAILTVRQEREARERQQRFREERPGLLSTFTAGVVADLPKILAEMAIFRSAGPLLRYARAPKAMQSFAARDVMAAGTVEYGTELAVAAMSERDTVEDAIVNGTIGTAISAAMIGGIEGVRHGWGKYKTGKRMREDVPLGASSEIPPTGPC